jgi:hypothetical protein
MVNPRVQKAIVHDNCGPTKKIADLARYKLSKDDAEDYLSVDHKILAAQLDQMDFVLRRNLKSPHCAPKCCVLACSQCS